MNPNYITLITDTYWSFLKNLNSEIKMELISRLSASVSSTGVTKKNSDARTEDFINKFNGAWKGEDSVEQTISAIERNHSSKAPVSFDI